jgi:hypothetical protein
VFLEFGFTTLTDPQLRRTIARVVAIEKACRRMESTSRNSWPHSTAGVAVITRRMRTSPALRRKSIPPEECPEKHACIVPAAEKASATRVRLL